MVQCILNICTCLYTYLRGSESEKVKITRKLGGRA